MGFRVYSTDVQQANLQSAEEMMRDVYLKPTGEFGLHSYQVLKLLKSFYGLTDSAYYRSASFLGQLKEDFGKEAMAADAACFAKQVRGRGKGENNWIMLLIC